MWMLAALDIGVRQFVHQRDARLARENGVHVHLSKIAPLYSIVLRGTTSRFVTNSPTAFRFFFRNPDLHHGLLGNIGASAFYTHQIYWKIVSPVSHFFRSSRA